MDENTALELLFDKRELKDKKTKEFVQIFDKLIKATYIDLAKKNEIFKELCLSPEYIQIFNVWTEIPEWKFAGFKGYELDWKQYFILDNPRIYFHKKILKLLLNKWKYAVDYALTMVENDYAENCRIWLDARFIWHMLHDSNVKPVIDVWVNEQDNLRRNYMSWMKIYEPHKDDCLTPSQLKQKFEDVVADLYDYIMWIISSALSNSWHTVVWSSLNKTDLEFFKKYFEANKIPSTPPEDFIESLIDDDMFQ